MTAADRRAIAHTRPGYATYDDTPAGNPSWWLRDPQTGQQPAVSHAAAPTAPNAYPSTPHRPQTTTGRRRWWHRWTRRTTR